jgi:hypothetical protein
MRKLCAHRDLTQTPSGALVCRNCGATITAR